VENAKRVVVQFDVEAALRRHLARQTRRFNGDPRHYLQKGERTFPNFLAVPGQTTPGRLTVTKWRFAAHPSPENENLPLPANASFCFACLP
jgi:hypothetical protein